MRTLTAVAAVAAICLASPAQSHSRGHRHAHSHRTIPHTTHHEKRTHGPETASVRVVNTVSPLEVCAYGYWCGSEISDTTARLINPAAKERTGIDRSQFLAEVHAHPETVVKMAWMVFGEVGRGAPVPVQIVQLETAFNRAQARGQTLAHVLLSVTEDSGGYYAGKRAIGGGTYCAYAAPSDGDIDWFIDAILNPVLAGSNLSDIGYGPMTGNASASVAAHQFRQGTPGYQLQGGDAYFREGPFFNPFPEISIIAMEAIL